MMETPRISVSKRFPVKVTKPERFRCILMLLVLAGAIYLLLAGLSKPAAAELVGAQLKTVYTPGWNKTIIVSGDNRRFPQIGDNVELDYTGKLIDETVFDSSRAAGRSRFISKIGVGQLIKGWDEAVPTMSIGERAIVTIHPDWAYGSRGTGGGIIPPGATLVFDVI